MSRAALAAVAAATVLVVASGTGGAVAGAMITGKQIKNGTVTGRDVKDGSLTTTDLAADVRSALTGPAGSAGPPGPSGPPGAPGDPAGLADGYVVVNSSNEAVVPSGNAAGATAYCPPEHLALGGGGRWNGLGTSTVELTQPVQAVRDAEGHPTDLLYDFTGIADGWTVSGVNHSGGLDHLEAWVICAPAHP